jgi:hypothetical protein
VGLKAQPQGRRAGVLAATALVCGLLLAGCGGAGNSDSVVSRIHFGPFAGYVWNGSVSSVSASWTEPRIEHAQGKIAVAATWIGAESAAIDPPFIQVGVNEIHAYIPRLHAAANGYVAFWSDSAHHFRPVKLFLVQPHDLLVARLTLRHHEWAVAITDKTSGVQAAFLTRQEAQTTFNEALWTQEDVSSGDPPQPLPYPQLSEVHFQHVAVNSAPPTQDGLRHSWMSLGKKALEPAPLSAGSFTLQLRLPNVTREGARFLRIADRLDLAAAAFQLQTAGWSAETPHSTIVAEGAAMAKAARRALQALDSAAWPHVSDGIATSTRVTRARLQDLLELKHLSPRRIGAWLKAWIAGGRAGVRPSIEINRMLRIPAIAVVSSIGLPHRRR